MTNTTNTIKIGKTTYTITEGGMREDNFSDVVCYVEGPRGAVKNIICFNNGCSRGVMPRDHKDIWGEEAKGIKDQIIAALTTNNV